ncbi:MAG TPA: DUF1080 domain-containing protein [Segetibacter sp.]
MKKLLVLVLAAAIFIGCNSSNVTTSTSMDKQANTLTAKEKKEGWKLLFDGTTTTGWHTYGYNAVGNAWTVEDGTLRINSAKKKEWTPNENRDIVTNDEYDNFHFAVDWKISTKGNSGIIFYVHEDKAKYKNTYQTGPEMQVLDNDGHPDGKIIKHRAGDLYDLISSSSEPVKVVGEWNHAEIKSLNGKLDFYLNGQHIVNTTLWDDAWKKLVAGSKFKSMPAFGIHKKGRIALQEHGDDVWYRNVKIRKL